MSSNAPFYRFPLYPERKPIRWTRGWWPSAPDTGPNHIPDSAKDGKNILWEGPDRIVTAKGLAGGPMDAIGGTRLYVTGSKVSTVNDIGSVVPFLDNAYAYCSVGSAAGAILIGGLNFNGTGGRLRFYAVTPAKEYNVGLDAPLAAPVLVAGAAGTITSGATTCVITRIRTSAITKGGAAVLDNIFNESNPSPVSNAIAVENQNIKFTAWPAAGTGLDAHDAWGIYVTASNEGNIDDFLFLMVVSEATIAGGGRTFEISWSDSALQNEHPPTDNFPPPTDCQYVAYLGGVLVGIGSRGGSYYSCSKQGESQHFSRLGEANMPTHEQVAGFINRPTEGELYYWTANSLCSFALSDDPDLPIYARALWPLVGAQSPNGACFAGNYIYIFTSECSPARMSPNGEYDAEFSIPVRAYLRKLGIDPSKVAVGYDPRLDIVAFVYQDTAYLYVPSLNLWCVPYHMNGNEGASKNAAVTFMGKLLFGRDAGTFFFEDGVLDQNAFIVPALQEGPQPGMPVTLRAYTIHCEASGLQARLYVDEADTTDLSADYAKGRLMDTHTGKHYTTPKLMNKMCQTYTLRVDLFHQNERLDDIEFDTLAEVNYIPNRQKG